MSSRSVTSCDGAARRMPRTAATKLAKGRAIDRELYNEKGIVVRARERRTIAEEMPEAYKDISEIIEVVHQAGLSRKVARLRPLGVVKG